MTLTQNIVHARNYLDAMVDEVWWLERLYPRFPYFATHCTHSMLKCLVRGRAQQANMGTEAWTYPGKDRLDNTSLATEHTCGWAHCIWCSKLFTG